MNLTLFTSKSCIFANVLSTPRCKSNAMNRWLCSLNHMKVKHFSNKSDLFENERQKCFQFLIRRQLSANNDDNHYNSRPLMAFKPLILPNLWIKMKNWITIHTIIRPFLDNHFNLEEFIDGSKQALIHISHCLADGNLDSLKDVISDEALIEIRHNFPKLNAKQIEDLRIVSTDILYSFVHTIGIIMNDNNNRWVEITVVYYCLHKYQTLSERKEISFEDFKEKFGPNITICNYRFIRDYTKGVENDWTVNLLAHFTKDNF